MTERVENGMEAAAGGAHHIQKVKLAFQICAKSQRPIAFINLFCDSPLSLSSVLLSNLPTPTPPPAWAKPMGRQFSWAFYATQFCGYKFSK